MHQTVAIRPTISNSLKTVLPEAPSTLPLSHKPYLHFRPPSKQMAPPPAAAVKLSNRNVPDPTQTSPYHRIKWQGNFRVPCISSVLFPGRSSSANVLFHG